MATPMNMRKVRVFTDATEAIVDEHGNFGYVEVTNATGATVDFKVNDYPENGHKGVSIPIPAGTTRAIPLVVYKFTASSAVTVVAYGL
jgi:hypothetical protein